ncbi:MAG: hypothetical protein M1546_14075 [Chloroflexi bacterium]|nr:hypothetical protein [Chloroflexota bacterium]
MFSNTSQFRFVWIHAALYGLLATVFKLFLAPLLWPSPLTAGISAFLVSAMAYRAWLVT